MMQYVPFTQAQREQARQTDLAAFLQSRGEVMRRSGSEYEWRDGAQKVTIRGNLWFNQYERVGGDAVDFVRRYYGMDYPGAVAYLLGKGDAFLHTTLAVPRQTKAFALPKANENMRRVYAYLVNRRGVDREVVRTFAARQMIYESEQYHNVVFVGMDPDGMPRHASLRGTGMNSTFKGNVPGSVPEYSFHWSGTGEYLYLFEAPIDLLSFLSMERGDWQQNNYAACCGVADRVLFQMLRDNPGIQTVVLCLDNDEVGQAADLRIAEKLKAQGIQTQVLIPIRKDWNEDLVHMREEKVCPVLQF